MVVFYPQAALFLFFYSLLAATFIIIIIIHRWLQCQVDTPIGLSCQWGLRIGYEKDIERFSVGCLVTWAVDVLWAISSYST